MTTPRAENAVEFTAAYDGDALREHTMPARDLAPALFALGESFERANTLLNGNRASLSLEVKANQSGSFDIVLILRQVAEQAIAFFSDDLISSAANIKELFFGGALTPFLGIFAIAKRSKGRPIRKVEEEDSDGNVTLEIDGLRAKIPAKVAILALDRLLNKNLSRGRTATYQERD